MPTGAAFASEGGAVLLSATNANTGFDDEMPAEDSFSDTYVVPLDRIAGSGWVYDADSAADSNMPGLSLAMIAKKYANRAGYQVTLHTEYLYFWDAIQVLRPATIDTAKEVLLTDTTANPKIYMPQDSWISSQGFLGESEDKAAKQAKYSNEANYGTYDSLYLSDAEIMIEEGDKRFGDGYITFDILDLSNRIYIKRLTRHGLNESTGKWARDYTDTFAYAPRPAEKIRLDDNFTNPQPDMSYNMGYDWMNRYGTTSDPTVKNRYSAANGRRNQTASTYSLMLNLLESKTIMTIDNDGNILADFTLNKDYPKPTNNYDWPIYEVNIATGRGPLTETQMAAMASGDNYETTYNRVHDSSTGAKTDSEGNPIIFTINYGSDWRRAVFGRGCAIYAQSANNKNSKYNFIGYLALRPTARNTDAIVLPSANAKGARMFTTANNVSEGSKFSVVSDTESSLFYKMDHLDIYKRSYALTDKNHIIYTTAYRDADGNPAKTQQPVTLEFDIPEGIDLSRLKLIRYRSRVSEGDATPTVETGFYGYILDKEKRIVTVNNVAGTGYLNASWLFCEEPGSVDALIINEAGVYELTVVANVFGTSASYLDPSMSAAVYASSNQYLVVTERGEGVYSRDLYLRHPPMAAGYFISDLFYYNKEMYADRAAGRTRADILNYYTNSEGGIDYAWDFIVPNRARIPLDEAAFASGTNDLIVNMIIPVMDALVGVPGSGSNRKDVQLRITSIKKYEGSDLPRTYDHSLLLGQIKLAERALESNPSEDFARAINAAKAAHSAVMSAEAALEQTKLLMKAELAARVEKVTGIPAKYFTSAPYSEFISEKVPAAEALIDNPSATAADLTAGLEALKAAADKLTFKSLNPGVYRGVGRGAGGPLEMYVATTAGGIAGLHLGEHSASDAHYTAAAGLQALYADILAAYPYTAAVTSNAGNGTHSGVVEAVREALFASARGDAAAPSVSLTDSVSAINTGDETPAEDVSALLNPEATLNTYGDGTYADVSFTGDAVTGLATHADSQKSKTYAAVKSKAAGGAAVFTVRVPDTARPTYATVTLNGTERDIRLVFGDADLSTDKTALQTLYDQVKALIALDFTAETWPAFEAARAATLSLLADEGAKQAAVDAGLQTLRAAHAALVKAPFDITRDADYSVNVHALQYSTNDASMMDPYINNPVALRVKDGVITLALKMKSYNGGDSVTRAWPFGTRAVAETKQTAPGTGYLTGALDPATGVRTFEFTVPNLTEDYYMGVHVVPMEGFEYQRVRLQIDAGSLLTAVPDETPGETANKAALAAKLAEAAEHTAAAGDYTAESLAALTAAVSAAQSVYDNANATQAQADYAVFALAAAITGLIPKSAAPGIDASALNAAIAAAKQLDAALYETNSYAALTAAVSAAEKALATAGLTQTQADRQTASVNAAALALADTRALTLPQGEFSLANKTQLKKYDARAADSMGNGAIDHAQSKLVISNDGDAALHLYFRSLTVGTLTGYLQSLSLVTHLELDEIGLIVGRTTAPAVVLSRYDGFTDEYGPLEGMGDYPKTLSIAVTPGQTDIIVEVYVPVMEVIGLAEGRSGMGRQLALLRVDWSDVNLNGDPADTTALEAAALAADAVLAADFTSESCAALAASVAAGAWLIENKATSPVTQGMVDARVAAILAAREALIEGAPSVDKAALAAKLTEARGKAQANYSAASYSALQSAIAAAQGVFDDAAATRAATDAALAALQAAIAALVPLSAVNPDTPATVVDPTKNGKYWLSVVLEKALERGEISMGNIAFSGIKALLTSSNGVYKLQVGTRPVLVSGYSTAITDAEAGSGFTGSLRVVSTENFTTNTKYDGTAHDINYVRVFELTLPGTATSSVPIRFKVPYTPMDAVGAATDGWLNARIVIDWSSASEAPADAELDPPTSVASGSSSLDTAAAAPAASLSDSATGIKLTAEAGVIPTDAVLKVSAIVSGDDFKNAETALTEALATDETPKFKLFDISLVQSKTEVQPSGTVTISVPIPAEYDKTKVVFYRINDDGTATRIKGKVSGENYEVALNHLSLYALVEGETVINEIETPLAAAVFTDITGHWAYEAIGFVVERGLFNGTSDTTFSPNLAMNRGMFVTVLGRMAGADPEGAGYVNAAFSDTAVGAYYTPYAAWAAENGIVQGVGEGLFAPTREITRQEMATMLCNYADFAKITLASETQVTFADDEEIASYAKPSVYALAYAGLLNGRGDGSYAPSEPATRAEVATMLMRFVRQYIDR
jgi:hypothetical protein